MTRTRWTSVLACFLGSGVVAWTLLDLVLLYQGWVPALTAWGAVLAVLVAAVVLWRGLAVRRLRARERTWITPIGAAWTAVAAQASAIVGAVVGGVYAAELVIALSADDSPAMSSLAWTSGICLIACLLWCGVGLLVEFWCAIREGDDDDPGAGAPGSESPDAARGAARTASPPRKQR
ncbi:Protein of uncharacterised function (DUF3180) [Actinomyces bovis]|uniref:Protein of uncharacterized function (DUF3180) n=1 Tax=Actinomyces bovis TaxID=1658 RepID=A0ABY1VMU8_9ACTO|nr:DUF3180 domain-containing protein [Actinomyces bovis]SPT53012.1 Protein of uncharacterised function (DUF3180) [Actinomyces bovis]VEG55264.1 Protein of uncharacterised function (DUF3180) [Actinomyces israelii]